MPKPFPFIPSTHREQKPVKRCLACGCFMRSFHDSTNCDPCGKPVTELTSAEVWKALRAPERKMDTVDALQELMVAA